MIELKLSLEETTFSCSFVLICVVFIQHDNWSQTWCVLLQKNADQGVLLGQSSARTWLDKSRGMCQASVSAHKTFQVVGLYWRVRSTRKMAVDLPFVILVPRLFVWPFDSLLQFIDLCILLGCDYCESIRGIGPKRAVDLIKQHRSIEKVLEHIDTKVKVTVSRRNVVSANSQSSRSVMSF